MPSDIRPKKSLGQHFLRDDEVHEEILRRARLSPADTVFEIGAGDGTLTHSLGELAGRVIAVETDRRCLRRLRGDFPPGGKVEIVEADIMEFDLAALGPLSPLKVVADLPYNIATAVLDRLLQRGELFSLMVLMFQKEVALRLVAAPGSRDYGSLSLATQYRCEIELVRVVPPEAFAPPPKVDSAIVLGTPRRQPFLEPAAETLFFSIVRAGFKHRRKTFLNSLARAGGPIEAATAAAALDTLHIPKNTRAESISLEQYLDLARTLVAH